MSSVYSSTVTGIFVKKFWVWPPQNIYPWQKSSSEVTEEFPNDNNSHFYQQPPERVVTNVCQ